MRGGLAIEFNFSLKQLAYLKLSELFFNQEAMMMYRLFQFLRRMIACYDHWLKNMGIEQTGCRCVNIYNQEKK